MSEGGAGAAGRKQGGPVSSLLDATCILEWWASAGDAGPLPVPESLWAAHRGPCVHLHAQRSSPRRGPPARAGAHASPAPSGWNMAQPRRASACSDADERTCADFSHPAFLTARPCGAAPCGASAAWTASWHRRVGGVEGDSPRQHSLPAWPGGRRGRTGDSCVSFRLAVLPSRFLNYLVFHLE